MLDSARASLRAYLLGQKPSVENDPELLKGALGAHVGFVRHHVGEYGDLTPDYLQEIEAALERVKNGATFADLMADGEP
jgi:hypothetical protein